MSGRIRTASCVLGLLLVACAEDSDADGAAVRALGARISKAQAELARVQADMETKREDAIFFECKASVEGLIAELSTQEAECMLQLASKAKCDAKVERDKGDGTLWGCGLGLLAAGVSGGTAAPWALAGCATGRVGAEMLADRCPMPTCLEQRSSVLTAALDRRKWSSIPQCGGQLGIHAETPELTMLGVLEVAKPGDLSSAGIEEGDLLAIAAGQRLHNEQELWGALNGAAGGELQLQYVRDGLLYAGTMAVPKDTDTIFVRVARVESATHAWGARVTATAPSFQGDSAELVGRDISEIDGIEVKNVDHLRELLRYRRRGDQVAVVLKDRRSGATETKAFVLSSRSGASEI